MTCKISWCTADAEDGGTHCTVHRQNPEWKPREPQDCSTCGNCGGIRCTTCNGTGEVPCEACNGAGQKQCECGRAPAVRRVRRENYDMVYADGKWRQQGRLAL